MNRGSVEREFGTRQKQPASMRPRFMNRGSGDGLVCAAGARVVLQ